MLRLPGIFSLIQAFLSPPLNLARLASGKLKIVPSTIFAVSPAKRSTLSVNPIGSWLGQQTSGRVPR